jgi:hypothetical protein
LQAGSIQEVFYKLLWGAVLADLDGEELLFVGER